MLGKYRKRTSPIDPLIRKILLHSWPIWDFRILIHASGVLASGVLGSVGPEEARLSRLGGAEHSLYPAVGGLLEKQTGGRCGQLAAWTKHQRFNLLSPRTFLSPL